MEQYSDFFVRQLPKKTFEFHRMTFLRNASVSVLCKKYPWRSVLFSKKTHDNAPVEQIVDVFMFRVAKEMREKALERKVYLADCPSASSPCAWRETSRSTKRVVEQIASVHVTHVLMEENIEVTSVAR